MAKQQATSSRPKLRRRAAAAYSGISARNLVSRRWRSEHRLPCYKVGGVLLFDPAELDIWLSKYREPLPSSDDDRGDAA